MHEAFLGIIQPGTRFDAGRGSLQAYLYGAVRNLVRAAGRNRSAGNPGETAADDDIVGTLIGNEMAAALHAAVRELPAAYRDAVLLCDVEERSYGDASMLMGCPVGTVRSRLHRARRLLAEKLKQYRLSSKETAR